jgi:hypothetical protein
MRERRSLSQGAEAKLIRTGQAGPGFEVVRGYVRDRAELLNWDGEEIAGPGGACEIDLAAGAVVRDHDEDSFLAFDCDSIAEAGKFMRRWGR